MDHRLLNHALDNTVYRHLLDHDLWLLGFRGLFDIDRLLNVNGFFHHLLYIDRLLHDLFYIYRFFLNGMDHNRRGGECGVLPGCQVFAVRSQSIRQLYQAQRIWSGQVILPFTDRLPGDPHALRQLPLGEGSGLPKLCNSLSD